MGSLDLVIGSIYDAVVDDEAYSSLASVIARELGAPTAWISQHDRDGGTTIASSCEFSSDIIKPYSEHYFKVDPWYRLGLALPNNIASASDRYIDRDKWLNSEIYNELIKKNGNHCHSLGMMLVTSEADLAGVSVQRVLGQDPFEAAEEKFLQALEPHLQRLVRTRSRMNVLSQQLSLRHSILDQQRDAIFLVDGRGRLEITNEAADDALRSPFVQQLAGSLKLSEPHANRQLWRAIREATSPPGVAGSFTWRASLEATFEVRVDPLRARPGQRAAAVVRVRWLEQHASFKAAAAAAAFGFTAAETDLLTALLRGRTPEEHAEARDVRMPTIRTQMRGLLGKSNTRRQAQLVAVVHGLYEPEPPT